MHILALVPLVAFVGHPDRDGGRVLAERTAPYIEDGRSGRAVAHVTARVLAGVGGEAHLEVVVSAVGPGVEPVPGHHGVPGHNHIAAREIQRLLRDHALTATLGVPGGEPLSATVRAGADGRVRERRFDAERQELVTDFGASAGPLSAIVTAGVLPEGPATLEVRVRGVPRLTVTAVVTDGGARIVAIESLGEDMFR